MADFKAREARVADIKAREASVADIKARYRGRHKGGSLSSELQQLAGSLASDPRLGGGAPVLGGPLLPAAHRSFTGWIIPSYTIPLSSVAATEPYDID